MIWRWIVQCWRWACTSKSSLSVIYNWGFLLGRRKHVILIFSKSNSDIKVAAVFLASQWIYWYDNMIWNWIVKCWRWLYSRTNASLGKISIWGFYWRGGSMSYWNSQKETRALMKLMCCSLTMVILIWENKMEIDQEVLKMIMQS